MVARTPPPLPVRPQNLTFTRQTTKRNLLCGPIPLRYHRALLLAWDVPVFSSCSEVTL